MPTVTKKGQVTIPKEFREKLHISEGDNLAFEISNNMLIVKREERKSILSLGGIAKGRKTGAGNERDFAKKALSRKIAEEGLKNG